MKLQINPHFFLNCLTNIYSMAQMQLYREIEQMALSTSRYFRYIFQNDGDFVKLSDKIEHVRIYLDIQKHRYPNALAYRIDEEEDIAAEFRIPPLVLQTFVENAVKYAVSRVSQVNIELALWLQQEDGEGRLTIRIADTGPGFPPEILECLQNGRPLDQSAGNHIGIMNTLQRLESIYNGSAAVSFSNREDGGACVILSLPDEQERGGMNILVVDDDVYVVAALEKKIEWKTLGIEKVYTANNVAQARDILQQDPVQILISDIEMPQGSGLDLLAWIREENYPVQAIFLTNYADFNYAQKAIELQSFEYFLKPIEFDKLMLILRKAVARAEEQQHREKAIQEGVLWQRNQANLVEYFWRKLVSASAAAPVKPAVVAQAVEDQQLAYLPSDLIQPLLLHVFPYNGSLGREEKGLFDFALGNVLGELLQHPRFAVETILEVKEHHWIAILKWNAPPEPGVLAELCSEWIRRANGYLNCDACCCVGLSGRLEEIGHVLHQLLAMNEKLTKTRNRTYWAECDYPQKQPVYLPPDLSRLEELLQQNDPTSFLGETSRYLRDLLDRKTLDSSCLALFRLDIVQLVYAFLKLKGIEAHKLYAARANEELLAGSLHSIEDMQEYVTYLVNTAVAYRDFAAEPKSVAEEIKQYIHAHYGDDLTRNDLAEVVYLNPDYLARLFKKETGISLGSYVIQVRISVAKQLLETSKLSVYAVANQVGYTNYSYFLKLFKQEVGVRLTSIRRIRGVRRGGR